MFGHCLVGGRDIFAIGNKWVLSCLFSVVGYNQKLRWIYNTSDLDLSQSDSFFSGRALCRVSEDLRENYYREVKKAVVKNWLEDFLKSSFSEKFLFLSISCRNFVNSANGQSSIWDETPLPLQKNKTTHNHHQTADTNSGQFHNKIIKMWKLCYYRCCREPEEFLLWIGQLVTVLCRNL